MGVILYSGKYSMCFSVVVFINLCSVKWYCQKDLSQGDCSISWVVYWAPVQ